MIIIISRWSYNCEGEHLCSQFLKDWWRENGGWLKFWASNIVYFWKWNLCNHPQFWLGWKSETQAMSRSKMDKNRQENEFGLAHIGESSFCSFLNNFRRPSWLAAFSVLKSETQSISRSRMGKNRRDCRKRKMDLVFLIFLNHIFAFLFNNLKIPSWCAALSSVKF